MNKEILEITKKFHDTYEKLASEYTYETREDTKGFDINSSNGKLMYATVNEIVSPILKENKILKENAENNDKVVDKVNWENQLLKKENKQLKATLEMYENGVYFSSENDKLKEENEQLKEQIKDIDLWNNKYNEEFNKNRMLEHNWNKLREYIKETKLKEFEKDYGKRYAKTFTQSEIVVCNMIMDKMLELEKGSDNK